MIKSNNIPFTLVDWREIQVTEHPGITGTSWWKTLQYGDLRIRVVEYSANYLADHWCEKGHLVFCIEGEMIMELSTGEKYTMTKGMSYHVSDEMSSHRSFSEKGVKLWIVDGAFLGSQKDKEPNMN